MFFMKFFVRVIMVFDCDVGEEGLLVCIMGDWEKR